MEINNSMDSVRKGCQDMWNAFMYQNARFTLGSDIPFCPCISNSIPSRLISYEEAKKIYKTKIKLDLDFHEDAYIHFYIDDQKFDGIRSGIWERPYNALKIIKHYSGIISPDFSTYLDMPDPEKRRNTLRMRAFGYWITTHGIPVINNVRWGTSETWEYCFDGIPYNSIVAIGTVASGLRKLENRPIFESGLFEMVRVLRPHTIIVYGSSNYDCLKKIESQGTRIITFPSNTSLAYVKERRNEYE